MSLFLRIAAGFTLLRVIILCLGQSMILGTLAGKPVPVALANGLALANLGLAFLFWRAAADPARERTGIYTALLVSALRGVTGTYEVLYQLDGYGAVVSLIDMVASVALFIGILNALPGTLNGVERGGSAETNPADRGPGA